MFPALNRILLLAALTAASLAALAQGDYPSKPVRIIVPFGPGGAADTLPRLVGQKLSDIWGQPVVVENRTGAAGNIGMELGAKAAPDGYTLTSAPVGNLAINPHLYSKLSFDVLKDFTLITLIASVQNVLVLNPAVPANDLKELIAYAKTRPGKLTYGSGGVGTQAHIGGEIFKSMTGVHMMHVAYKGVGDSVTRSARRPDRHDLRADPGGEGAHRQRQAARARRREPDAIAGAAERADDRRSGRAAGVSRRCRGTRSWVLRECRPRSSRRSRPMSRRSSSCRRSANGCRASARSRSAARPRSSPRR